MEQKNGEKKKPEFDITTIKDGNIVLELSKSKTHIPRYTVRLLAFGHKGTPTPFMAFKLIDEAIGALTRLKESRGSEIAKAIEDAEKKDAEYKKREADQAAAREKGLAKKLQRNNRRTRKWDEDPREIQRAKERSEKQRAENAKVAASIGVLPAT